jgi:hypothetical protein
MSRIDDGFATLIEFSAAPNVKFWEKDVTPPGADGGGANDTTTMRNVAYRTKAPKKLKTLTDMTLKVAYDPACYDDIITMLQDNQAITITFPDDSKLIFWGWIDKFVPDGLTEGTQPTASVTVIPSNQDESENEVAPHYISPESSSGA